MARQANDGRGRLGGRSKGTQNKPKKNLVEWAGALIDKKRRQFEKDLDTLTPSERAAILGKIIAATIEGDKNEVKEIINGE